jgi:DNA-binding SARP family transcriptional activator
MLGPLEVIDGGRPLPLGGLKQRALLAVLLLHANEVVSTDRLIDELWGDHPPSARSTALRVRVAQLRKALGRKELVITRPPGYLLRVGPGELDLHRFERLVEDARDAEPALSAAKLGEALALWHGTPLADLTYEPFAQAAIGRLQELRLVALERRIEADLTRGCHAELVAELGGLVQEHPLRERLRAQLMLALYRSGRQAEALEVYAEGRRVLAEELGLEPSRSLRALEKDVLRQDPGLEVGMQEAPRRSILVVGRDDESLDALFALAEPLARQPAHEVIVVTIVSRARLAEESAKPAQVAARTATFSSPTPGRDIVRLCTEQDVDLLLLAGALSTDVEVVLDAAPCDVALLPEPRGSAPPGVGRPVLVPFTGAEHDWAAVELAAWTARATGAPLVLAGSVEGPEGRDASRLLASASLIVQRAVGVRASSLLIEPGIEGLVASAREAGLIAFGVPPDWRRRGLGDVRLAVMRAAAVPTLFVRKGLRPGGLAPAASQTRFTWSVET